MNLILNFPKMQATYLKKVLVNIISSKDILNIVNKLFRDALKNEESIIYFGENEEYYIRLTEDGYSYLDLPNGCYTLDKRSKEQIIQILTRELFD